MCIKINKIGKQEVGIWWVQKHFPRYGIPIWSLWPNIRFLPLIVAEKNATKNKHICSMCIKISEVGKQEVGNTNFIVFGLTQPGLEPTIYRIQSKQLNHCTTNVVNTMCNKVMWHDEIINGSKNFYFFIFLFTGVSECIIMGIPMGIGTGLFKLLHKYPFCITWLYFSHLQVYIVSLSKLLPTQC